MYQIVKRHTRQIINLQTAKWALRLLGICILVVLLIRSDLGQLVDTLKDANLLLILASVILIMPLIFIKTVRWQGILRSQSVQFHIWPAYVAYFSSLFVGFVTPGRLGEFVKAVYVSKECEISPTKAFSSVLADRLFDLYLLLIVGILALVAISTQATWVIALVLVALLIALPMIFIFGDRPSNWVLRLNVNKPNFTMRILLTIIEWGLDVRTELTKLTGRRLLLAIILTLLAYFMFFGQCYMLAKALDLNVGFLAVCYVIALGSLVTLLPISISGLGTREAVMVVYLGSIGISSESALGFSILVFLAFYLAGGSVGAVAWLLRPVPLQRPR